MALFKTAKVADVAAEYEAKRVALKDTFFKKLSAIVDASAAKLEVIAVAKETLVREENEVLQTKEEAEQVISNLLLKD